MSQLEIVHLISHYSLTLILQWLYTVIRLARLSGNGEKSLRFLDKQATAELQSSLDGDIFFTYLN